MMISRQWTGLAQTSRAQEYIEHLRHDTFAQLHSMHGFISASIFLRELEEGVEFLIITNWDSFDAIKQFAGADIEKAVVPKAVQDIMIRYDDKVRHYNVVQ
jgi:heme-degrading monooxygenase HmoA